MIHTLAVLCLVAAPAFGLWEKGFKVRYDNDPEAIGTTSYMDMPITRSEASDKGWEVVTPPELPSGYDKLVLLCLEKDYSLCLLYDDNGYIAGLQLAMIPEKLAGAVFDWAVSGFIPWTVSDDDGTVEYQAIHQFYVSAETLASDSSVRLAARDDTVLLQDQLYVKGFNGDLYNISTNIDELSASSDFVKLTCIPGMGNHYYHKMSSPECRADTILVWFGLEYEDQLVGVGFMLPGNYTTDAGKLAPFEHPDRATVKLLSPAGPACMWDYGDNPGMTTMHTYFVKDADKITC
ncbi:uncharacterized protein LOC142981004 [Anticarsia gemmatalis]|uniref:uncharacterized protein LOC142981004 n=1 Tax=Anticarsia gemmatalis TaxID=129554 RepID=UPI003F75A478